MLSFTNSGWQHLYHLQCMAAMFALVITGTSWRGKESKPMAGEISEAKRTFTSIVLMFHWQEVSPLIDLWLLLLLLVGRFKIQNSKNEKLMPKLRKHWIEVLFPISWTNAIWRNYRILNLEWTQEIVFSNLILEVRSEAQGDLHKIIGWGRRGQPGYQGSNY